MAEKDPKEEKKERKTGLRGANFSDVLIEMGDDFERWFRGIAPWGALAAFFAFRDTRAWARRWLSGFGRGAVLTFNLCREVGGPVSNFFRNRLRPTVHRFRRSQRRARRRERVMRRVYWGPGWFERVVREMFGINPGL